MTTQPPAPTPASPGSAPTALPEVKLPSMPMGIRSGSRSGSQSSTRLDPAMKELADKQFNEAAEAISADRGDIAAAQEQRMAQIAAAIAGSKNKSRNQAAQYKERIAQDGETARNTIKLPPGLENLLGNLQQGADRNTAEAQADLGELLRQILMETGLEGALIEDAAAGQGIQAGTQYSKALAQLLSRMAQTLPTSSGQVSKSTSWSPIRSGGGGTGRVTTAGDQIGLAGLGTRQYDNKTGFTKIVR